MKRTILAALGVVALLGGCGSDDSQSSLSDTLRGSTWKTPTTYQVYHDDGTYAVATTQAMAEGDVSAADIEWGTWSLDENVLTLVTDAEAPTCADTTGVYRIELADDENHIEVTLQEDPCGTGGRGDFPQGLTRVES